MMAAMQSLRRYGRPVRLAVITGGLAAILVAVATLTPIPGLPIVVATGLIVGAIFATYARAFGRFMAVLAGRERRSNRRLDGLRRRQVRLDDRMDELAAIAAFSALDARYPLPLGGKVALGWDAATILAREVGSTRPDVVVELGSGASSLVIGQQLRAADHGRLYTVDHAPEYAEATRRHVEALDLGRWVTVLDAPLVDCTIDAETYRWYSLPAEVSALPRIDLLVVDGPPQKTDPEGMPRFPALPVLSGALGPGSAVFVDDTVREAEQRMVDRWMRDQPDWIREDHPTRHGTAILRRPA